MPDRGTFKRKRVKIPVQYGLRPAVAYPVSISASGQDANGTILEYYSPCKGVIAGFRVCVEIDGASQANLLFEHWPEASPDAKRVVQVPVVRGDQVIDLELQVAAGDLIVVRAGRQTVTESKATSVRLGRVRVAFVHSIKAKGLENAEHEDA